MEYILKIVLVYSIVQIVVYEDIFRPFRDQAAINEWRVSDLLSCHSCFSVWVGAIVSVIYKGNFIMAPLTGINIYTAVFLDGLIMLPIITLLYKIKSFNFFKL